MKIISSFLIACLLLPRDREKQVTFAGSTPANNIVRAFLGIPLSDSVDFIRWKIAFQNGKYVLHCNYGIGKPNTSGFINGGRYVDLKGILSNDTNYYYLHNGDKTLALIQLNADLLHIVDAKKQLLIGNGGWSYTLNNVTPSETDRVNISPRPGTIKDSMAFQGRTPCAVPGILPSKKPCYKLKWYLILYSRSRTNQPTTYKLMGTAWPPKTLKIGEWKVLNGKDRTVYQLNDEKGNALINLVKLDENILAFSDTEGKLIVGDENFSYTLSRKW